jgi:hypothetical protein
VTASRASLGAPAVVERPARVIGRYRAVPILRHNRGSIRR